MKFLRPALLFVCLSLSTASLAQTDGKTTAHVSTTLRQMGLTTPIDTVKTTGIGELLTVRLQNGETFLITPDARHLINGTPETNPSPIRTIDPTLITHGETGTPTPDDYRQALLANMTALSSVTPDTEFFYTSIKGLLWAVAENGTPFLVSANARHIIGADISVIENGELMGLDDTFEHRKNRHTLASLDETTLTIYPAKNERAVLYVATDINCPYCRVLHGKISELNAKGITLKIIGYPVYDESPKPMRQIWCESDNAKRASLLTLAMKGVQAKSQCTGNQNPLQTNIAKARPLTIMATPAIYNDKGELFEDEISVQGLMDFLKINDK